MAKHTKEGIARNKQLLQTFRNYQARIDQDVTQVQDIIAGALKNNGITEATLDSLATVFRGYDNFKTNAEQAWERYHDHCTTFDYEVQD